MPLENAASNLAGLQLGAPCIRVSHSGRHEAAIAKPGNRVEITILLKKDAAGPGKTGACAGKVEFVDFDRFPLAMARGVEAEAPRRSFRNADAVHVESLEI